LAFSLTRLVAIEGGLQGRQLLPALGSIAILIVTGWWVLTPSRWRGPVLGLLATILLALALWLPYSLVAEAYLPPPALTESELPSDLSRLDWVYNEEIKLIGVTLGAEVVQPGQRVPVTAYWQALRPLERNYSVFVHLIGRGYENVGQFNTYPGLGLHPTSTLLPGQIIADTYPVLVNGGSEVPTRLLVNIGLFDFQEAGRPGILPTTSAGSVSSPTIGQLKLIPTQWPTIPDEPPLAQFADQIWLTAYHFEGCQTSTSPCQLTFEWLAQAPPAANYTVFIQLWPLTPAPEQFYGFDGPPLQNDYPTSLWASGEVIHDPQSLDLANVPPGTYQVLVGWYQPETGQRLAASTAGEALANQAVDLGRLSLK
jgi:hypothetical protein